MDDTCPQTIWTPETEPATTWEFDGCLGNTSPVVVVNINPGFAGTLLSLVVN